MAAMIDAREAVLNEHLGGESYWRYYLRQTPERLCRVRFAGSPQTALAALHFWLELSAELPHDALDLADYWLDEIALYAEQLPKQNGFDKRLKVTEAFEEMRGMLARRMTEARK